MSTTFAAIAPASDADRASPATRAPTDRKFGRALELRRQTLLDCANRMQHALPRAAQPFLRDLVGHLQRQSCKIAIIGQVKAGKSTFVNSFVQRPGLLPTDINPWTTAVTRLHFGCADQPEGIAARFSFFDPSEWEHIWTGGGRLRELTERFVPGFEPELLREHVTELKRRAEMRLGGELTAFLGQVHEFPELTPGLVERYVSAGPSLSREFGGSGNLHFSDIVRTADIAFPTKDFAFPVTLIDTPGTNDPFLVRDEITRRALDSADIHVVVLIARQALSLADVALLRILRGLHKDRIVVFINRIDELGDIVRDVPQVVQEVRAGLAREFPGSDIPIVAGSAYWAEVSAEASQSEAEQLMTSDVRAYAAQIAKGRLLDLSSARDGASSVTDLLMSCSGLPALTEQLARLSLDSHASHVLRQVTDSLLELGQVSITGALQEHSALSDAQTSDVAFEHTIDSELVDINDRVEQTERLLGALNAFMLDVQARTSQVVTDRSEVLYDDLRATVEYYASVESEKLRRAILHGASGKVWRCETTEARRLLEAKVLAGFEDAHYELWGFHAQVVPQIRRLVRECIPDAAPDSDIEREPPTARAPSISALGQFLSLDVSEPFWKRWWALGRSADERSDDLANLIYRAFLPIVDELSSSVRAKLDEAQAQVLNDLTRNFVLVAEALQEQSRGTLERMQSLLEARAALADGRIRHNRDMRIGEIEAEIAAITPLLDEIRALRKAWPAKRSQPAQSLI